MKILKKVRRVCEARKEVRFKFIHKHKSRYSVKLPCAVYYLFHAVDTMNGLMPAKSIGNYVMNSYLKIKRALQSTKEDMDLQNCASTL